MNDFKCGDDNISSSDLGVGKLPDVDLWLFVGIVKVERAEE